MSAAASAVAADPALGAMLQQYCITCHNQQLRTGGLVLSGLDVAQAGRQPELWEKVVRKLRTGAMPPAGMPRPDKATYDVLASYLEKQLDQAAAARPRPSQNSENRMD